MARALPYIFFINDWSQDFLNAEDRVLRSKKCLQFLEDMRSIWMKQGRARTGRMGSEEGERGPKGAMVVLLVMSMDLSIRLFWTCKLGAMEASIVCYWNSTQIIHIIMMESR